MVTESGSTSIVRATVRRQLSQVSPTMPAMRSTLSCGKPSSRIHGRQRSISLVTWARPFSRRISSSKLSMPRERRVTPRARIASSLGCESVPGSHSKVTSSAPSQEIAASRRAASVSSCATLRKEGVPPPT